jgi:hypothetical protein
VDIFLKKQSNNSANPASYARSHTQQLEHAVFQLRARIKKGEKKTNNAGQKQEIKN